MPLSQAYGSNNSVVAERQQGKNISVWMLTCLIVVAIMVLAL